MADSKKPALRVAISGGGIGGSAEHNWQDTCWLGCALALALQQRGFDVLLFEKDTSFSQRRQGYGLTLQQGCVKLLEHVE